MLDLKWIRSNVGKVQEAAKQKGIEVSVQHFLDLDQDRKNLLQEVEVLRHQRNVGSQQVGVLLNSGQHEEAELQRGQLKKINEEISVLNNKLQEVEEQFRHLELLIPNVPSEDTPIGSSDEDNVEVRRIGQPPIWDFTPKSHIELGMMHDMLDLDRGSKVGGARSYYLKGGGFLLHRAVQQLALDILLEAGFTPMEVPLLVREDALMNTGHFPTGRQGTYKIDGANKWLVGTSEVPLVSYYSNEVLDLKQPLRLAAVSSCFRSEVGSAGRDVKGLYRVHQFAKVEMVVLCEPEEQISEQLLQEITGYGEQVLTALELPYRVMAVCTGDMSQKTYKQYDLETWMPSRNAYGETHSASNLSDFQARRSNIRCNNSEGELEYCHTLNNTAVASPRILIPLLENHQQSDGSIYIPRALRKYMNGMERLTL